MFGLRIHCITAMTIALLVVAIITASGASALSGSQDVSITFEMDSESDASLKALTVDPGALSPAFSAAITTYAVEVDHGAAEIAVTATSSDGRATLQMNDEPAVSGEPHTVTLGPAGADTIIEIDVTAANGVTTRQYTITVSRAEEPTVTHHTLTMLPPRGRGTVLPPPGSHLYPQGTVVHITAEPSSGWDFARWSGAVEDRRSPETTVTMHDDRVVMALFSPVSAPRPPAPAEFAVTVAISGRGSTIPEPGTYRYDRGTEITVRAIPDAPGSVFGYWMLDDVRVDVLAPLILNHVVERDVTITAVFVRPPAVLAHVGAVVRPGVGGALEVPGFIALEIPPGATPIVTEYGVSADFAEEGVCLPRGPLDGLVFDITAVTMPDEGQPVAVTKFADFVTLTLTHTQALETEGGQGIQVHYYHDVLDLWIPIPTSVDPVNQRVTAQIDRPGRFVMCITEGFTDVVGHWGERDVLFLATAGSVNGFPDGTFRPDEQVTREQFAKMLVQSAGVPVPPRGALWFADGDSVSGWAVPQVMVAARRGLVRGFADHTFRPRAPVTRAQVAVMISRALGVASTGDLPFSDADVIPDWAYGHVAALSRLGMIHGYHTDGAYVFRPDERTTRAETAAFLSRYLEQHLGR